MEEALKQLKEFNELLFLLLLEVRDLTTNKRAN